MIWIGAAFSGASVSKTFLTYFVIQLTVLKLILYNFLFYFSLLSRWCRGVATKAKAILWRADGFKTWTFILSCCFVQNRTVLIRYIFVAD